MTNTQILSNLFDCGIRPEELVSYAVKRHGYCLEGYYGVTYPTDLDEYDKEILKEFIPEGYLEILYWDGKHKEMLCSEKEYLLALDDYLTNNHYPHLVEELKRA